MEHARFFGFGSLVNCATHSYPNPRPARLIGWRRIWMPIDRDVVALSVHPAKDAEIEGLTADVPGGDWQALDAREAGYTRDVVAVEGETQPTWVYAVPGPRKQISASNVILQSYLDVVLQGFLTVHGPESLKRFFQTTDGWDIPVLDDRAAPRYPRHQPVSAEHRDLFDALRRALT